MQSFLHLLAWIGVGIFALLCAHAAFKFKQSEGAGRLNDAFTSIGGGTFSQQITTKVRRFFWGIMLGVYGLLGFGCFALTGSVPIDPPTNQTKFNRQLVRMKILIITLPFPNLQLYLLQPLHLNHLQQ